MANMTIEKVEFKDLANILELQKLCYQENAKRYNDFNIQPLTQTLEELEKDFNEKDHLILKVEDNSNIIGSIRGFTKNKTCYIEKVIVHPDYQNKGVGTKLLSEIEKRFDRVEKYELYTGYKDEKNIYFYKKAGFNIFKEKTINKNLKFVFMEKYNRK